MADDVDERPHSTAIRAAVTAAMSPRPDGDTSGAYDVDDDEVNGDDLPPIYVTVHLTQRYVGRPSMGGATRGTGWRITTRVVGRTLDEARWARKRVHQALRDRHLVVAGVPTGRVRFETEDPIDLDDGRYSGATTWTYAS